MSVWLRRAAAIALGLVLAALPFIHSRYGSASHHAHHDHHHQGESPRPDGAASKGVDHASRAR